MFLPFFYPQHRFDAGYPGQVERAIPEAGLLRLHGDHLRVDQVRGEVVH